jgi:hypothetical protein
MPFNSNMGFSPAGQALGLGGLAGIPGLGAGFGFGDQQETEEERRKRLGMVAQQRGQLTQQGSPATQSLFGGIGGFNGTGLLR